MHQNILMKKYTEDDDFVSYQVNDYLNCSNFFVRIDKKNRQAIYFKNQHFNCEPIGIIDLKNETTTIPTLPGIMRITVNQVTYEIFKVIAKNIFPDTICYTSS
jgi:hypothetical protein